MKTIHACLLATALFASTTRADIVIYRGTLKLTADLATGAPFPKPVNLYLIVDFDAGQFGTLAYGQISGSKRMLRSDASDIGVASVSVPKGHTATFLVNGMATETSTTVFSHNTLYFRGTNKDLLVRKTPAATLTGRPNTLLGLGLLASSSASSAQFGEEHLGLTFQGATTIKANNANQTIAQALDALVTTLTGKGFSP